MVSSVYLYGDDAIEMGRAAKAALQFGGLGAIHHSAARALENLLRTRLENQIEGAKEVNLISTAGRRFVKEGILQIASEKRQVRGVAVAC